MNANDALHLLDTQHLRRLTPQEAAEEAVTLYLELGAEIEIIKTAQAACNQAIVDLMIELAEDRIETHAGMAIVTSPGVSVSYDAKVLDRLLAGRPDLSHVLAPYRTEKERPGVLMIRAAGGKHD